MKKSSETDDTDPRILDRLRAYTALDNPIRLRAFRLIHESPGVAFNEIAKAVRIESGLLAYHIGVLKAAGLVDVAYERDGRAVTSYRIGATGAEIFPELFGKRSGRSASRGTHVPRLIPARPH